MLHFDHIIIGTGQATATLLGHFDGSGESVAVIEGDQLGGTCVNTGCTPTKTLVASARVAHLMRRAPVYGIRPGDVTIDYPTVHARMNRLRHGSRDGLRDLIESMDETSLFRGWAQFTGPKQIRVSDDVLTGEHIYINTGARPRVPDVDGLDAVDWLDHARLLDLTEVPEHLIILGGSYVGLEFSQIFRRFGAQVTIIEKGDQLMPREDPDVARGLYEILEGEGIRICLRSRVQRVRPDDAGVVVAIEEDGLLDDVRGSHLLVAAGRVPNSDWLNLEAAGIETDARGYIVVDDCCRTSVDGVFALGDVNGHGAFTHTSVNDAEIVRDVLTGGTRRLSDRIPIYALFTDPPLGRVGLSEREALERGHQVLKATRPMASINRAKEMGETQGFVKLLVDAETDRILGAAILGAHGDEIVNMFAAFMYSGQPCHQYRKAVLVHPTISELMPWILDGLEPVYG